MKKKIISGVMCLAMLLSLLPVSAFAAVGANAITALSVAGVDVDVSSLGGTGTLSNPEALTVEVPFGTVLTNAAISVTAAETVTSVKYATSAQTDNFNGTGLTDDGSGAWSGTADLSDKTLYLEVTVQDDSAYYALTITEGAADDDTVITALSVAGVDVTVDSVAGDGSLASPEALTVEVPFGTNLSNAAISVTAAETVTNIAYTTTAPAGSFGGTDLSNDGEGVWTATSVDLSDHTLYIEVTAQDDSTAYYALTITEGAEDDDAVITALSVAGVNVDVSSVEGTGILATPETLTVEVPFGTDLANAAISVTAAETVQSVKYATSKQTGTFTGVALTAGQGGVRTGTADLSGKALYLEVTAQDDSTAYYALTITVGAADDDAVITALSVAGTAVAVDAVEGTGTLATPEELSIEVPYGTLDDAAISVTVAETVSSVAYATAEQTGTFEGTGLTGAGDGVWTAESVNLSGVSNLYIEVTAQDGSKAYYKLSIAETKIVVGEVGSATDTSAITDGTLVSEANTAASATKLNSENADILAAVAFDKVNSSDEFTEDAARAALSVGGISVGDDDPVYIHVIPRLEIVAKSYDNTSDQKEYVVDITPYIKVVAAKVDTGSLTDTNSVELDDVALTQTGDINVTIGIPSGIAGSNDYVNITHTADKYFEKVVGGTVTISVSHFSEFTISKATNAALSGLTLSNGELNPAFDPTTVNYTVRVNNSVDSITVTPTAPAGFTATVKVGGSVASGPITLDVGQTTITVEVSDENGALEDTTYTIVVTRDEAGGGGSVGGGGSGGSVSGDVTISSTSNGKVTVTPTAPSKGATVTINLTPDTGYEVGSVTVKDADGNTVDVVKVNDTQYTFVMPDGKVTVSATFTQVQQPSDEPFTDVSASDYFYDAVLWAVEQGITTGDGVNTFGPNKSCTRAQMVTFLWRAAGSPAPTGTNSFNDVAAGEYYTDAVLWAVEKGITNGTGIGTFSPNDTVTRGQTVTFLYRYAGSPAVNGGESFGDVASTDYFADAVQWAVANGITYGDGVNTFSPAKDCTRGQIVTFMYRQMAE